MSRPRHLAFYSPGYWWADLTPGMSRHHQHHQNLSFSRVFLLISGVPRVDSQEINGFLLSKIVYPVNPKGTPSPGKIPARDC